MLRPCFATNSKFERLSGHNPKIFVNQNELRRRIPLLPTQRRTNLRQRRMSRRFPRCHHFRRLREIIPNKRFYIRLDDYVRLRPPCQIRMTLQDVECTAENIRERPRFLKIARFQINGDDDIRTKQQSALYWHGRRQESVD